MSSRLLTDQEIKLLGEQHCWAEDWKTVSISPGCDLARIRNVRFRGEVHLAGNAGAISYRGLSLPCGIYDADIADCIVENNVRIAAVRTGMTHYRIEAGALIQDVGMLTSEPGASFGSDTEADVVNEAGGRGMPIFGKLTAQVGYLAAMFRHNQAFVENLRRLVSLEIDLSKPDRGIIGRGAVVVGCGRLHNVLVGPFARIEGAAVLENGTINSCEEDPTSIGSGVHARAFVVAEGARVESSAILERTFVGQGVRMGKQYSAENSAFFANCEAFHGEGVALFAGPYTVSHHKSTLMIAGLFSFFNAGSGTNQSNHMYKLGPVHQGIFERGCKTGSFSYVLFESQIGAFSVVIGKHLTNIRIPNLPFSYITEKGGESSIIPGMNLFSIGLVRDGEKWPKRDNRKAPEKRDLINFDVFSPYTVEKMRRGRDELLALNESTPKDRASVLIGGILMSRVLLRKGAKSYQSAINRYLYGKVLTAMASELGRTRSWSTVLSNLQPTTKLIQSAEWTDVCGLLAPVELIRAIESKVIAGAISSYQDLIDALNSIFESYSGHEWQYVVETFEKELGTALPSLTKERALQLVDEWQKASLAIQSSTLDDSKKEFGSASKIGFGLDLPESDTEADFVAVRGTMETNAVVRKMVKEGEEIAARASRWKATIGSAT
jgi:hypothetical protein